MSRDRFVHVEGLGARRGDFGYADDGFPYQTKHEAQVAAELQKQGWTVHRTGWPDLIARRGDEVQLIEVKGPGDSVRANQRWLHRALMALGVFVDVVRVP